MITINLKIREQARSSYPDVMTPEALNAIAALAPLDHDRQELMNARMANRLRRVRSRERLAFLDPDATIPRTGITVRAAR